MHQCGTDKRIKNDQFRTPDYGKLNCLTKLLIYPTVIPAVRWLCQDPMDVINSLEQCRMELSVQHHSFPVYT
jgi:hypothetical protein